MYVVTTIINILTNQSHAFHAIATFTNKRSCRYFHYCSINEMKKDMHSISSSSSSINSISSTEYDDDSDAKSQFGTKEYWDDMYNGYGDLDAEEYSWYYTFKDTIQPIFKQHIPLTSTTTMPKMLVPGIGNDNILIDLYNYGYHDITAFDYSSNAIKCQIDLLSYYNKELLDNDNVSLVVRDGRCLDDEWTNTFDIIFEKGALDAIYLSSSDDGNVEKAVTELGRVIKPGGYFISVSGVVPEELRREMFQENDWEWIRDGCDDKKAGCFIWKRLL